MHRYYKGISDRMLSEISSISDEMSHAGEKGRNNELVLKEFLERHLPRRYTVTTGKVLASGGAESNQIDLIVSDRLQTPALKDGKAWSLVPIESAFAVISVKTTLNKTELRDAMESIASVRVLPRNAAIHYEATHIVNIPEAQTLQPRAFVFAFQATWATSQSVRDAFENILLEFDDDIRPNGLCILNQCLLTRKPYAVECTVYDEQPLMHWLVFLVRLLDTFPKWHVDLTRYFEDYEKG